jgi:hypothetical protein
MSVSPRLKGEAMMPQVCDGREASTIEYQGLVRVVGMIARHPDFPGKRDAVRECVSDIVDRSRQGRLSPVQRAELLKILLSEAASD